MTKENIMTFEEFQSSKVWTDNLGGKIDDMSSEGVPPGKGFVYCDTLYIEEVQPHWAGEARQRGRWYLLLNNSEYISDDFERLEQMLYEFAVSEGYEV
jgi:hypothetical protein